MPNTESLTKTRAILLDVMRIYLCLGVLVYHYTPDRCASGPFMVIGFFVMSGMLMGLALNRTQEFDVVRFYQRKAKRFLPLYFIGLFAGIGTYLLWSLFFPDAPSAMPSYRNLVDYISLVSWSNVPLWFMGVEFLFLLAAPCIYVVYRERYGALYLSLGSFAFSAFLFSQVSFEQGYFKTAYYYMPLERFWQIAAGLLMAKILGLGAAAQPKFVGQLLRVLFSKYVVLSLFAIFLVVGAVLMVVKQCDDLYYWNYTFQFEVLTVAFFMLLIPALYNFRMSLHPCLDRVITYAAILTYPVYLLHIPVRRGIYGLFKVGGFPNQLCIGIIAAIVTVICSHCIVELLARCSKGNH